MLILSSNLAKIEGIKIPFYLICASNIMMHNTEKCMLAVKCFHFQMFFCKSNKHTIVDEYNLFLGLPFIAS